MVSIDRVVAGLGKYIDAEIMPALPEKSWQKVAFGAGVAIALKKYQGVVKTLTENEMVKALGVIDGSGNVDIDLVATTLKEQMGEGGMEVALPIIGKVTLYRNDIDSIYRHIVG